MFGGSPSIPKKGETVKPHKKTTTGNAKKDEHGRSPEKRLFKKRGASQHTAAATLHQRIAASTQMAAK